MWRFLLKTLIWTIPGTIACYGIWIGLLYQNPSRDTLGLYRVMPVQCNSMIFGTSRSAQGVNPAVLEQYAPHTGKWFNFSFNLAVSPWNDAYADAIIEKIDCSIEQDNPSTFLLFVDPWVLDGNTGQGLESWLGQQWASVCDASIIRYAFNKSNPLDALTFGSGADFLIALSSSIPRQIIATIRSDDSYFVNAGVQTNGWLPNRGVLTPEQIQRAIDRKVSNYREDKVIGKIWPDEEKIHALVRTVAHLKNFFATSQVILIRPPVSEKMLDLENEWFPDANSTFDKLAKSNDITFIDANANWKYRNDSMFNDGHHMNIKGATEFSRFMAESLASR